jgi:UDP-N-acetylmuramate dehydrogenase
MYEELMLQFGKRARLGEPMSRHTTFRIGGPVDLLVDVESEVEVQRVVRYAEDHRLSLRVIGRGANLLVSDAGVRGIIVRLVGDFRRMFWDEETGVASVGAGTLVSTLLAESCKRGYDSLCWAAGIPGTVGGAVACNAGAWGHAMGEFVEALRMVTREGDETKLRRDEMVFGYRVSSVGSPGVIMDVTLRFNKARGDEIEARRQIAENLARKRETQPLDLPSAGSIFKNPPQGPAGQLIDRAGCKGMREGDAVVSPKHANFIVNEGKATATDVVRLIERVRERVKAQFGVELELEIGIL